MNTNDGSSKITLKAWFTSLKRTSKAVVLITLVISIAVVAYAAGIIFDHAQGKTNFVKDRYVKINLSGAEATGKVKPGDTVSLSQVLTNNGSVPVTAIIRLTVPAVNKASAYDYEVNSSWTLIESDPAAGEYIYGYGTKDELSTLAPGESTDPLVSTGFTMKSSITGSQFSSLSSVDIVTDGYLVDSEEGTNPGDVWRMVGE